MNLYLRETAWGASKTSEKWVIIGQNHGKVEAPSLNIGPNLVKI